MNYTAYTAQTNNTAQTPPNPTGKGGKVRPGRDWLARLVISLSRLPQRAATLLADGYTLQRVEGHGVPGHGVPGHARRLHVFKPGALAGSPPAYTLDLWEDLHSRNSHNSREWRYRCTCPFYRNMVKHCALTPQCKHGIAAAGEVERRRAARAEARETLAWVAHFAAPNQEPAKEAKEAKGAKKWPSLNEARERTVLGPDSLDRLVAASHFGLAPNPAGPPDSCDPAGWCRHFGDVFLDTRDDRNDRNDGEGGNHA